MKGTSLDTQVEIRVEEAKKRGYHVSKEEGYNGALGIDARPVFHQLWEKYQVGDMTVLRLSSR